MTSQDSNSSHTAFFRYENSTISSVSDSTTHCPLSSSATYSADNVKESSDVTVTRIDALQRLPTFTDSNFRTDQHSQRFPTKEHITQNVSLNSLSHSLSPTTSGEVSAAVSDQDSRRFRRSTTRHRHKRHRHENHDIKKHNKRSKGQKHRSRRDSTFSDLPLEWWERDQECQDAKFHHVDQIDRLCSSREFLVLQTTLWKRETELERNMFPCELICCYSTLLQCFYCRLSDDTPKGIEHYTLWSRYDLTHNEV
jgi:hypothetical protein